MTNKDRTNVYIRGTISQLARFSMEAGLTPPNPDKDIQFNINMIAKGNDTLKYVFSEAIDEYVPLVEVNERKVDMELANIYRVLLVNSRV